jgi:hypothetical protein
LSRRRRLGLVSAVAGVVLVGFVVARHAGVVSSGSAGPTPTPAGAPMPSGPVATIPGPAGAPLRLIAPTTTPTAAAPAVLTPVGAARALQAIAKNDKTRRLFMRLQSLGLSPEQQDRVLLILGTEALRPSQDGPTLEARRAEGGSRVLSEDQSNRVRAERHQITERTLRTLRPALAAVLTPAQLTEADLGGDGTAP